MAPIFSSDFAIFNKEIKSFSVINISGLEITTKFE